jgi:hypothetical protein
MIPKIIWQTYETDFDSLPDEIKDFVNSWIKNYKNFEYRYASAIDRENFVLKYFGKEWHNIFCNLPFNAMRLDIWKYMTLYIYGGIIFDLDISPIYDIEEWLINDASLIVFPDVSDPDEFLFNIKVIASEPYNLIIKNLINNIFNKITDPNYKLSDKTKVYHVTQYTGDIPFFNNIKEMVDPNKTLPLNPNFNDFNNLKKSKEYGLYCYNQDYDTVYGKAFNDLDGSKVWGNNYIRWRDQVLEHKDDT